MMSYPLMARNNKRLFLHLFALCMILLVVYMTWSAFVSVSRENLRRKYLTPSVLSNGSDGANGSITSTNYDNPSLLERLSFIMYHIPFLLSASYNYKSQIIPEGAPVCHLPSASSSLTTQQHHSGDTDLCSQLDVIIMVGPDDKEMISRTVPAAVANIIGRRRIIIISPQNYLTGFSGNDNDNKNNNSNDLKAAEWISDEFIETELERRFGYRRDGSISRWKHQQLIKLYSPLLIPNLLSQVLIMDGEVIWLHPTTFLDGYTTVSPPGPVSLYTHGQNIGDRYNPKYEHFLESILPSVAKKVPGETFIAHHILIQKDVLTSLMMEIEKRHGHSFWETFLHFSKHQGKPSEYELYSRYILRHFPDRSRVRDLKYIDTGDCLYQDQHLDYLSCHHHLRISSNTALTGTTSKAAAAAAAAASNERF